MVWDTLSELHDYSDVLVSLVVDHISISLLFLA